MPNISNSEIFELTQTIYYICFKEIIRNISVQCLEQGILLWKIWRGYMSLIDTANCQLEELKKEEFNKYSERINFIQENLELKIKQLQKQNEDLLSENESLKKDINSKRNDNTNYEEIIKKLNSELEEERLKISKFEKRNEKILNHYREKKAIIEKTRVDLEILANLFPQFKDPLMQTQLFKKDPISSPTMSPDFKIKSIIHLKE